MKTILIKATVPDDMNLPLRNVIFSDENTFFRAEKNIKIIEPPTLEEIEYQAFHDSMRAGKFERGVNWTLKYLGL